MLVSVAYRDLILILEEKNVLGFSFMKAYLCASKGEHGPE